MVTSSARLATNRFRSPSRIRAKIFSISFLLSAALIKISKKSGRPFLPDSAPFFQSMLDMIYIHPMNLNSLDLNLLVALDALLSEANVSRAAMRIGLSQPALTHALQRLRD